MILMYEDTNLTEFVDITACEHRDASGGRSDCLALEMEHAETWYRWGPSADERIEALLNGYSTGTLYLSALLPENGRFRLLATGIPRAARQKDTASYTDITLSGLLERAAAACGMGWTLYGLPDLRYAFLMRKDEGLCGFLDRLLRAEGGCLKACGGALRAVSVAAAQALEPVAELELHPDTPTLRHRVKAGARAMGLTVRGPLGMAEARDAAVSDGPWPVLRMPVPDPVTARRWAQGTLLHLNRGAETLTLTTEFSPNYTALARVDVTGGSGMDGAWLIDEARHDLYNERTRLSLVRCVTTIE